MLRCARSPFPCIALAFRYRDLRLYVPIDGYISWSTVPVLLFEQSSRRRAIKGFSSLHGSVSQLSLCLLCLSSIAYIKVHCEPVLPVSSLCDHDTDTHAYFDQCFQTMRLLVVCRLCKSRYVLFDSQCPPWSMFCAYCQQRGLMLAVSVSSPFRRRVVNKR